MSERKKEKAVRRLNELGQAEPVLIVFNTGRAVFPCFVYDVSCEVDRPPVLYYTKGAPYDWDGSKVNPRDFMPSAALGELGYVKTPHRKISLVPFHY